MSARRTAVIGAMVIASAIAGGFASRGAGRAPSTATVHVGGTEVVERAVPRPAAPEASEEPASNEEPRRAEAEIAPARKVDVLLARLASEDPFEVLDAADALAARRVTAAIPILSSFRLARSPEAAPSVIDALGRLAGVAPGPERAAAAERLRAWLHEEKARRAPDSIGNVLTIYEALGNTGDAASARALEADLRDPEVSRAAKTIIVASLARLRDPASRRALEEARHAAASAVIDDAFEDEIRGDLLAEIDRALGALPG